MAKQSSKKPVKDGAAHYVNTLLHGNVYDALNKYAQDHGFSEPAVMRIAIAMLLKNAGYLSSNYYINQRKKS